MAFSKFGEGALILKVVMHSPQDSLRLIVQRPPTVRNLVPDQDICAVNTNADRVGKLVTSKEHPFRMEDAACTTSKGVL